MSDDFIPLNQSTPVQQKWQSGRNQNQRYQNKRNFGGNRRGGHNNKWGNSPRNNYDGQRNSFETTRSSFERSNSSNNSYGQDSRTNIDAYLHPSMLKDPWLELREKTSSTS